MELSAFARRLVWHESCANEPAAMFHNILCPIDFTTFSHHALGYAVALARAQGGSLTGVHVVAKGGASDLATLQAQVLKILREANAPSPTALAVLGDPATEIEKLATAVSADLIVMPLHGWTGRSGHRCGSVTDHVLCQVGAPVLIVPDTAALVPSPLTNRFAPCVAWAMH
jgi:nucleotide-binding universal stress UspA family protein